MKVIVYDNATLGFVAMEMKASGYLDTATDLKNPNFAEMANAMGVLGLRVEQASTNNNNYTNAVGSVSPSGPCGRTIVS